jgi:hypothetical protein
VDRGDAHPAGVVRERLRFAGQDPDGGERPVHQHPRPDGRDRRHRQAEQGEVQELTPLQVVEARRGQPDDDGVFAGRQARRAPAVAATRRPGDAPTGGLVDDISITAQDRHPDVLARQVLLGDPQFRTLFGIPCVEARAPL